MVSEFELERRDIILADCAGQKVFLSGSSGKASGQQSRAIRGPSVDSERQMERLLVRAGWVEQVPDAGELQSNESLANADKYSRQWPTGCQMRQSAAGLVEMWVSDQKRSQQAFGGIVWRRD
ncbi:hypothetical protein J1614_009989 [Plenodomus biglobosus]|nr:hypothetical protein J1614_009989 [Plenodomus biglobosus]